MTFAGSRTVVALSSKVDAQVAVEQTADTNNPANTALKVDEMAALQAITAILGAANG
jgi:hypothetical protein